MDVQVTVHSGPFLGRPRIYPHVTSLTCDGSTWRLHFGLRGKAAMVILTDVRFHNEAEYILRAGGYLAHISRTDENGSPYVAPDRDPQHESETALDDWILWDFAVSAPSGRLDLLENAGNTIYGRACAKHAARLRMLAADDPASAAVFDQS